MESVWKKIESLPVRDFRVLPKKEEYPLHSLVVSCGYGIETERSYDWDGMKRGDRGIALFQYTISGWGMLQYENSQYKVDKGKAMLLHIPHNHRYFLPEESREWRFIYVCLAGAEVLRVFHSIEEKCVPMVSIRDTSPLFKVFLQIHNLASHLDTHSPYTLSCLAYEFAMDLLMEMQPRFQGAVEPAFIEKAKDFCRQNYDRAILVSDIASAVGYSRYHFSRLFKEAVDMSPHDYLEHLRINKACEILLSESLMIKEVAWRCGYKDVNYFCKAFQKLIGVTPNTFRKRGY